MEGVVFKTNRFSPHAVCKTELRRTLIFSQMVVKSRKSLTCYLNASIPKKTHVLFFSNSPHISHKTRFKIMYFNSYAFLAITFSGNYLWRNWKLDDVCCGKISRACLSQRNSDRWSSRFTVLLWFKARTEIKDYCRRSWSVEKNKGFVITVSVSFYYYYYYYYFLMPLLFYCLQIYKFIHSLLQQKPHCFSK